MKDILESIIPQTPLQKYKYGSPITVDLLVDGICLSTHDLIVANPLSSAGKYIVAHVLDESFGCLPNAYTDAVANKSYIRARAILKYRGGELIGMNILNLVDGVSPQKMLSEGTI